MELVLQRRKTMLEVLSALFPEKKEHIHFEEEGVIKETDDFQQILAKIHAELCREGSECCLTIVDNYILNFKEQNSLEKVAEALSGWVKENKIQHIDIYSRLAAYEQNSSVFVGKFDGSTPLEMHEIPENIHDRFWIFRDADGVKVLSVGASLNGDKAKLSLVFRVDGEDKDTLLEILSEKNVKY